MSNDVWHLRILLADDDMDSRHIAAHYLTERHCLVEQVRSGHEAWDFLTERQYDLVVSDIQMPGVNGVWLLTKITTEKIPIPVVLMSGDPSIKNEDAIAWGASALVQKPFDASVLWDAVIDTIRSKHEIEDQHK